MTGLLLRGGHVCDPATGRDGPADVLIEDGTVVAVGAGLPAEDAAVLDVSGLIVGPGFVDLHSHVHSVAGQRLQALDGVTTALELEAGLMPVDQAYRDAAGSGRPLNYGFSASWAGARAQVLLGLAPQASIRRTLAVLGDPAWQRSSSAAELAACSSPPTTRPGINWPDRFGLSRRWGGSRVTELRRFAGSSRNARIFGAQLAFVWYELNHNESGALAQIRAVRGRGSAAVNRAALRVREYYERPSVFQDARRQRDARRVYYGHFGRNP